jgi:hypothetical protein
MHGALSRMGKHKLGLLEQLSVAFVNGMAAIRHDPSIGPSAIASKDDTTGRRASGW